MSSEFVECPDCGELVGCRGRKAHYCQANQPEIRRQRIAMRDKDGNLRNVLRKIRLNPEPGESRIQNEHVTTFEPSLPPEPELKRKPGRPKGSKDKRPRKPRGAPV